MEDNENTNKRNIERVPVARVQKWLAQVRAVGEGGDPKWTPEVAASVDYVENVLLHGNSAGRDNPTIDLPVQWRLSDICAVLGATAPPEPGSTAAWRCVRGNYDALYIGGGSGGGR